MDGIIDRSPQQIGKKDFLRLSNLNMEYKWLLDNPEGLFELWCLTDDDKQKNLIELLIKNFVYIDGQKLTMACRDIATQIENTWSLTPNNTYLAAICDNSNPDGSQSLIQNLKNKFSVGWRESNFYNSIAVGVNEIPNSSYLILIDDFIGTGNTIKRKMKYVRSVLEDKVFSDVKIKIVSLAAMNFSKDILNTLEVDYYSVYWLDKGISEQLEEPLRASATMSMEQLEDKLQKRHQGRSLPNFGYKRSESLFSLETANIPNNVFPIFWWPSLKEGIERATIFRRI